MEGRSSPVGTLATMASSTARRFAYWVDGYKALQHLSAAVAASGLEPSLLELVKLRASQLNGCAYCLDMHSKDARAQGETEQRIYGLSAWREAPYYAERERAALALTEAVTLVANGRIPEAVLEDAAAQFAPEALTKLLYLIIEINAWNRLAIATGAPVPGTYVRDPA